MGNFNRKYKCVMVQAAIVVMWVLAVCFMQSYTVYAGTQSAKNTDKLIYELQQFEEHIETIDDNQIIADIPQQMEFGDASEWTRYSSDFYYNQLTQDEKILYDRLETVVLQYMDTDKDITNIKFGNEYYIDNIPCQDLNLTSDRARFVAELFYQSESQYYFLRNTWTFSRSVSTGKLRSVSIAVYDLFANGQTRAEYTEQFRIQIEEWKHIIEQEPTDYLRQKKIHDMICEFFIYEGGDYDQSVISGLLDYGIFHRKTVCAGYAKAFQILCNAVGIDSLIIVSDSHAWNFVLLEKNWFCVDCTYDSNLYPFGITEYLDISANELLQIDKRDGSKAHTVSQLWSPYKPDSIYNYSDQADKTQWKIGKDIIAGYDRNGTLTLTGVGNTYSYAKEQSPLQHTMYAASFETVVVAEGVAGLGDYVLSNGQFTTLVLPKSLKKISDTAFYQSNQVEKIENKSSLENVLETMFGASEKEYIWKDALTATEVTSLQKKGSLLREEIDLTKNGVQQAQNGNWYYYKAGVIDKEYSGVAANEHGWWKITNGVVDFTFTGLATNEYGNWKITDGMVDFGYTGLINAGADWWYVSEGAVDYDYTGVVLNEYGWWKVTNGAVDFNYTGLANNEYGWWKITNGAVDFNYTGLTNNEYGWWKVTNGAVDFGYTGLADNEYGWWKVTNGAVDFGYTGLADNEYGWWKVTNGAVDFSFTGIAENAGYLWYLTNGAVNFTYSGIVEYQDSVYEVENGVVVV